MSAERFVELNQSVKDLCEKVNMLRDDMDKAYRAYRNNPCVTLHEELDIFATTYRMAHKDLAQARATRREYLEEQGLVTENASG
jgi:hypothetical protein